MKYHWPHLLSNLKYQPGDKIIDIGGAMDPCLMADMVVDLMNIGRGGKAYHLCDLNTDRLPFEDKSFDIAICCQTLEDLCSPRLIVGEMMRVAKRGIIESPHRGVESLKNKHYDGFPKPEGAMEEVWHFGTGHHKWLIEEKDGALEFTPKIQYMLMRHPIPKWTGPGGVTLYWEDGFKSVFNYDIFEEQMEDNYADFRLRNKEFWQ